MDVILKLKPIKSLDLTRLSLLLNLSVLNCYMKFLSDSVFSPPHLHSDTSSFFPLKTSNSQLL